MFRRAPSRFRAPGPVAGFALALALAGALTLGTAAPALSEGGFLLSTKSVAAPSGFHGVCDRYAWACARRTAADAGLDDAARLALAAEVNARVNRTVREISDQRQYRAAEVWALPTKRGGDCEDFALLKKRELIRRGVEPDRLLIATALTRKREAHAVLILRSDRGDLVLDNLTDRIRPWQATGYSFLRMQDPDAPGRWQMVLAGGIFGARAAAPGT